MATGSMAGGSAMAPKPRIVLQLPISDEALLGDFLDACVADNVALISIVGEGCEEMEEEIDWILVGGSNGEGPMVTTSSHPDESLDAVMAFAAGWRSEGPVRLVRL